MTEVLEELISFYFRLMGYFTLTRVVAPCEKFWKEKKRKTGALSDFDVIAYSRHKSEVIITECKGWGSPESYPRFDAPKRLENLRKIAEKIVKYWEKFVNSPYNKYGFKIDELKKIIIVIPGSISDHNRILKIFRVNIQKHRTPLL